MKERISGLYSEKHVNRANAAHDHTAFFSFWFLGALVTYIKWVRDFEHNIGNFLRFHVCLIYFTC